MVAIYNLWRTIFDLLKNCVPVWMYTKKSLFHILYVGWYKMYIFSVLVEWQWSFSCANLSVCHLLSSFCPPAIDSMMHTTIALNKFEDEWSWPTFDLLF